MTDDEFRAFYAQTAGALHAYLSRVAGDPNLADDLSQHAYLRLLRMPDPPENRRARRVYLFRTATNLLRDHRRREGSLEKRARAAHEERVVREGLVSEPRREGDEPSPVGAPPTAARVETRIEVRRAMDELGERDRELLWLAYVVGMSHRELAEILEVQEASVRVIMLRARRRLAAALDRRGLGPEDLS